MKKFDCGQKGCGVCVVCKYLDFIDYVQSVAPQESYYQRNIEIEDYLEEKYKIKL